MDRMLDMIVRLLGLLCLILGLFIGLLAGFSPVPFWLPDPSDRISLAWKNDLSALAKQDKLPEQWKQIKEVEMSSGNEIAQRWLSNKSPKLPVSVSEKGAFKLETLFIHWQETPYYGVIIEHHLVDLENGNTIWEMGRTYKIGYIY